MTDFLSSFEPLVDPTGTAEALQDSLEDPAPQLSVGPSLIQLPGGWQPAPGTVCREAEVRELTGDDEEMMARVLASSTGAGQGLTWVRLRKVILERGLVAINGYRVAHNPDIIRQLLIGDRDAILLGIRIATWGPDFEGNIFCRTCNEHKAIIFELDKDIKYKTLDDPATRVHATLRKGRHAVLRRPMADDEDFAFGDGTATNAEVNSRLLSRLLLSVDGVDMITYPDGAMGFVRALGIKDRDLLRVAVNTMDFGPRLGEVVVACPDCDTELSGALGLPTLF
jgi:hypothetical protein